LEGGRTFRRVQIWPLHVHHPHRFRSGGSGASRKLWSQEVEEIAGQRYRCQAIFSDIFRQKFRYHPKIFCLKPYLHGIERFFLEKGEWRMGKEKGERKKERGEWVKEQKEKNQEKRERERPYIGRKKMFFLRFDADR